MKLKRNEAMIKTFKKKHDNVVSLTNKNPNWLRRVKKLQIITLVSISVLSMIILTEWKSNFVISVPILFVFLVFKSFKSLRTYVKDKYYWRDQLLYFIRSNNLYTEDYEEYQETDSNGKLRIKKRKYISSSAVMGYEITENEIIIIAYKLGNQFSAKMMELDIGLSALVNLPLENKIDHAGYTEYHFLKEKIEIEQSIFEPTTLDKSFFDNVPIDVIKLTSSQEFSLQKNTNLGLYGRTGAGKTVALQWYLYNAIAKGCGTDSDSLLSIVDGKGADLFALGEILQNELGDNVSVGETANSLAKLSREFVEIMNARFEVIKNSNSLNADAYDLGMTPNFLFIDELASIRDSCGSSKQGRELWNEILKNLGLIARKGRQAGCHLCISTQDPNAENIPVELRNQITSVLYLGNPSNDRLKMAFSMCELENVPTISGRKGEALFYADGNNMIEPDVTVVPYVDVKTKQDFIDVIRNIKPIPTNCN
ncbi:TPA: hypothetical protein QCU59_005136 [Bacillus cereus]|nr:hypothetical protein [Bacillus cereus]